MGISLRDERPNSFMPGDSASPEGDAKPPICNDSDMDEQPILVELRDGYRVVTFNRPQRLNACTEPMLTALTAALAEAEADKSCRALLLTGAGRAFCTGQDLTDRLARPDEKVVGGAQEYFYNPLVR